MSDVERRASVAAPTTRGKRSAVEDRPRALKDPQVLQERRALLSQPHMASLVAYVGQLRARPDSYVPDFDPLDGGVSARVLLLMEKPGPKTDPSNGGSGFISRDNDDRTAEAIFDFAKRADLPRETTVIWNFIPWWNKTIAMTASERKDAITELPNLLKLFPRLAGVILVGRTASRALPFLQHIPTIVSAHPSAQVFASYPDRWHAIPDVWRRAKDWL